MQGGYQTESLLEMLKTGVSGFTTEEISALENYAYLWKVSGPGWRQEFVRHPGALAKNWKKRTGRNWPA